MSMLLPAVMQLATFSGVMIVNVSHRESYQDKQKIKRVEIVLDRLHNHDIRTYAT
jgi:hypothetical protein